MLSFFYVIYFYLWIMSIFLNYKSYELSNHLGNVMVTVSDKRLGQDLSGNNKADFYFADVQSATDYFPFGKEMPGRQFNANSYRFSFNGKEDDTEWGNGLQDYGFRIYSKDLGKFLSVDPLTKKYSMLTPYQYASNTPIWAVDMDGLEAAIQYVTMGIGSGGKEFQVNSSFSTIDDKTYVPDPKYGDKGILTIYTNIDNAEKSRAVYSSIHVEVEPTKMQKIKKEINNFSYKENILYPVEKAVQSSAKWAVIEIFPLGKAMNQAGLLQSDQTTNVITGESLGSTTNKVVGGLTGLAQFVAPLTNMGYNVVESAINHNIEDESTNIGLNAINGQANTLQTVLTTNISSPVDVTITIITAITNTSSSFNAVSISNNNDKNQSTVNDTKSETP